MINNIITLYFNTNKPLDNKTIQYLAEKLALSITLNSLPINTLAINQYCYDFKDLKKSVRRNIIPDLIDNDVGDKIK